MRDAGFKPGTNALAIWSSTSEPHVSVYKHIYLCTMVTPVGVIASGSLVGFSKEGYILIRIAQYRFILLSVPVLVLGI